MFDAHKRFYSFKVTSYQTILAKDIQACIWETDNKIQAVRLIREKFAPIGLRDAKEIYEAIQDEVKCLI